MSQNVSPEEKSFRKALKPTVFLGSALAIFPRNDMLKPKDQKGIGLFLQRAYASLIFIFVAINLLLMLIQYIRDFNHSGKNFMEKFGEFTNIAYAFSMAFIHGYHLMAPQRFRDILENFHATIQHLGSGCLGRNPSYFVGFCWLVTLSSMLLGILESVFFDMQSLGKVDKMSNSTRITRYFDSNFSFSHWKEVIPSRNPVVIVIIVILVKLSTLGWIFMDTIVIILCQALSLHFQGLDEAIQNELIEGSNPIGGGQANNNPLSKDGLEMSAFVKVIPLSPPSKLKEANHAEMTWDLAQQRFRMLIGLTRETESYAWPLILACYACLGHVLVALFASICPDIPVSFSTSANYYVLYSSVYFSVRVGVVTYFASKVSHSSFSISETIEQCPNSAYSLATDRLEKMIDRAPVGIRLFGTFTISRHSVVTLLSFIFTTEIVLLQMASAIRPGLQQPQN